MTDIKMSDAFQLPLTAKLVNGDARLLINSKGQLITSFSGTPDAALHMAKAINAYDDNQERIAELEAELNKIYQLKYSSMDDAVDFILNCPDEVESNG